MAKFFRNKLNSIQGGEFELGMIEQDLNSSIKESQVNGSEHEYLDRELLDNQSI